MTRHVSGTFLRADRTHAEAGATVGLQVQGHEPTHPRQVSVLELGLSDLLLSDPSPLPLGTGVTLTMTLRDRYIEFKLDGVVTWRQGTEFRVSFESLTLRQTYGVTLAFALAQAAATRKVKQARAALG